ncbi:MAG: MFS transporter [Ilumatobacteraceae bacterium]
MSQTLWCASVHQSSGHRILPLVFTVTLTGIMGNSLVSPLLPDILDTFDRSAGAAGPLVAAASLPGIFLAPLIGFAADRWGRRPILTLCLIVFGCGGVFTAIAPNFATLVATRFLLGIGSAGLINLGVVLIGDHFDGEERTTWIGRNAAMLTVGLAIIPLVSGVIGEFFSWRIATLGYGLGFVSAAYAWRVLRDEPARTPQPLKSQLSGVGTAMKTPVIATTIVVGTIAFAVVFGVFLTAMPHHLENRFSMSSGWRGFMISVPALSSALVGFNMGRIRRKVNVKWALATSAAAWAIGMLFIGWAQVVPMLLLGTLFYGLGEGALIPNLQEVAMSEAPPEHRGAVVATWVGFARLGQTIGPLLAGVMLSASGAPAVFVAGAIASAVAAIIFVVGPIGRTPATAS